MTHAYRNQSKKHIIVCLQELFRSGAQFPWRWITGVDK